MYIPKIVDIIRIKSRKQIYEKNDIGNLVLPQSDFWSKCFDHIWQEKHFCNVEHFEANKTQTRLDRFYIFWIAAQFYDDACKKYFSPSSKIWCNKSLRRAEILFWYCAYFLYLTTLNRTLCYAMQIFFRQISYNLIKLACIFLKR